MEPLTHVSLFSGIGGFELAMAEAGIPTIGSGWSAGMTDHPCPFSAGQLLALYAIVAVRGEHPTLARLLLEHAQQHEAHTHQEAS